MSSRLIFRQDFDCFIDVFWLLIPWQTERIWLDKSQDKKMTKQEKSARHTNFSFSDDETGIVVDLLFVLTTEDAALAQVRRDACGIDGPDE